MAIRRKIVMILLLILVVLSIMLSAGGCGTAQDDIDAHESVKPKIEEALEAAQTIASTKPDIVESVDSEPEAPESVDLELIGGSVPPEMLEEPEYAAVPEEEIEQIYESTESGLLDDGLETGEVVEHIEPEEIYYADYSPSDLRYMGVINWGGYKWTWYSEKVLPGYGLAIPGRWSDGDFVRDESGYICLASSDLSWGTVVDTPWGAGRVYDSGCASGVLDVYVSW